MEATGQTEPETLDEIEDTMRHIIFHSTLDWQTREELADGARDAWAVVSFMRSPAGEAYVATLTETVL